MIDSWGGGGGGVRSADCHLAFKKSRISTPPQQSGGCDVAESMILLWAPQSMEDAGARVGHLIDAPAPSAFICISL